MPAVNILDQVRQLAALQKIDEEIYRLKRELEEKPQCLEQLKQDFEKQKARLKQLDDRFKAIQVERQSKEVDLQVKDEAIAKVNMQLGQIKTNREYTAKLTEIESLKADKSIIEEKILILYDEGDAAKAAVNREKAVVTEEEQRFLNQKKEIDEAVKRVQERIRELEQSRVHVLPNIDKATISRYERILVNKDGLALVPVRNQACGGCFMNVPAQVINEIKMHEQLIYCEMCSRILYLEDEL